MKRRLAAIGFVLAMALAPRAFAGDAEARAAFGEGVRFYDLKDYDAALSAFQKAYAEKPSPGIQRNIALCLRALHRYPEAIAALEEMLARGGDSLDTRTREAAQKAIDEMSASVAVVRVSILLHAPAGAKMPPVSVRVDEADVPLDALGALRLTEGEHVFRVSAPGYVEAIQRESVRGGERDRPVVIELVGMSGPGVTTRDGATLLSMGTQPKPAPPRYVPDADATVTEAPEPKPILHPWYAFAGLTLGRESLTVSPTLGEQVGGASHGFTGQTFTLRFGRRMTRGLSLEMMGELGTMSPSGALSNASEVNVTTWLLAPELRLHTNGRVQVVGGIGLGLAGEHVSAHGVATTSGTRDPSGNGAALVGLLEGGLAMELGRVLAEVDVVLDSHGVGAATDRGERFFLDSPASRVGLRMMLGYAF